MSVLRLRAAKLTTSLVSAWFRSYTGTNLTKLQEEIVTGRQCDLTAQPSGYSHGMRRLCPGFESRSGHDYVSSF